MVRPDTHTAIVIAAGLGSRIVPLSHDLPKCMLEIQGRSMLHRAIATFQELGIEKSIVVGGYMHEKLDLPPGAKLVLNDQYRHNNILHSLAYARQEVDPDSPVLITYSDIVFRKSVVEQLLAEEGKDIVIVVDQDWQARYEGRTLHPLEEAESVQSDSNGRLIKTGKGYLTRQQDPGEWSEFIGMLKLSGAGSKLFWDLFDEIDVKLTADSPFQQAASWRTAYITDLFQELADRSIEVTCTRIHGGWLEIDTLQDYEWAQSFDFMGGTD